MPLIRYVVLPREKLLFRATFPAEFGVYIDLRAAARAKLFGCQGLPALGTELSTAHLGSAMRTGGDYSLLELITGDIIDLGCFLACVVDSSIHLDGGIF